jgi:hypothetical protein
MPQGGDKTVRSEGGANLECRRLAGLFALTITFARRGISQQAGLGLTAIPARYGKLRALGSLIANIKGVSG